jgi:hypothetical protein
MTFDIRQTDLTKLNSLTKYPSILTYHVLGDKGILQEQVQIPFSGRVLGTEKVDGTNARMIFCPDGSVLVGSREDLLWERRDLIGNPAMSIVETLKPTVQRLTPLLCQPDRIAVFFGEVYGKNIGAAAKHYSRSGQAGFRLFDVLLLDKFAEYLDWPADRIARWRDDGGQPFVAVERLAALAQESGLDLVPPLFEMDAAEFPTTLEETSGFLQQFGTSQCKLDPDASGQTEGIVVRSADRTQIAKIRREDYDRSLKRREKSK